MEFKEVFRWRADNKNETTDAIIVVSSCGNVVKRLPYKKWNEKNNSYSNMKEHIYSISSNRGKDRLKKTENKYQHVSIAKKTYQVHRLVALAWIPNPQNKPQVNHINGIKNDNRLENLEWVTNLENRRHSIKIGLKYNYAFKVSKDDKRDMINMRNDGYTLKQIAEKYNVSYETVRIKVKNND